MKGRDPLRTHLVRLLDWHDAHVSVDDAVDGLPVAARGRTAAGLPHSVWQLVEHIRLAQADILEFCRNAAYREKRWPEDYWPAAAAPPTARAWRASLDAYHRDLGALRRLATNASIDLFATVPTGTGHQTYLRELLLVADHTAYHVGQIVLVRRRLGVWRK